MWSSITLLIAMHMYYLYKNTVEVVTSFITQEWMDWLP